MLPTLSSFKKTDPWALAELVQQGRNLEKVGQGTAGKLRLAGRARDGHDMCPRSPFERSVLVFCPALPFAKLLQKPGWFCLY